MWYVQPAEAQRTAMRGSGIFVRVGGGPGKSDKKSSDNVFFFFFFLVFSLSYRSQMVNFKEKLSSFKVTEGSNFSRGGGPTFSRGVQLPIPYINPYDL